MKGRMYKPFASCFEEQREMIQRSRPWEKDNEPQVYMWASSIPEKLLHMKGQQGFQHVSEAGINRNTQDFLENNQKYIRGIADPLCKTPSVGSRIVSRVQSPQNITKTFFHNSKFSKATLSCGFESLINSNESASVQVAFSENKQEEFKTKIHFRIPEAKKRLTTASSMKNFVMSIPDRQESGYLVNKYSIPKGLVGTKKSNIGSKVKFRNPVVNEFLQRFEKKNDTFSHIVRRKGLNGWKLVDIKKSIS
ncbi:hypothetical protein SteCoe_14577 [Stentor coeruleus]|uniref:Uncharacterized protein n=1 Tax=Stentor coeruleus TaxID=5963 RepID=A0A1R2C5V2_9CILI|nr:hypothetical protein SteCoe_14577 [Stentor coeruleus]